MARDPVQKAGGELGVAVRQRWPQPMIDATRARLASAVRVRRALAELTPEELQAVRARPRG